MEVMVVLALLGLIAGFSIAGINVTKQADMNRHIQHIHMLAQAAFRLKEPLKQISNRYTGGALVINAAFPHGERIPLGTTGVLKAQVTPLIGNSIFADWRRPSSTLNINSFHITEQECSEILMKVSVAPFVDVLVYNGNPSNSLTPSQWPLSYTTASSNCKLRGSAVDITIVFRMTLL